MIEWFNNVIDTENYKTSRIEPTNNTILINITSSTSYRISDRIS